MAMVAAIGESEVIMLQEMVKPPLHCLANRGGTSRGSLESPIGCPLAARLSKGGASVSDGMPSAEAKAEKWRAITRRCMERAEPFESYHHRRIGCAYALSFGKPAGFAG